jgi:hypothetical protein
MERVKPSSWSTVSTATFSNQSCQVLREPTLQTLIYSVMVTPTCAAGFLPTRGTQLPSPLWLRLNPARLRSLASAWWDCWGENARSLRSTRISVQRSNSLVVPPSVFCEGGSCNVGRSRIIRNAANSTPFLRMLRKLPLLRRKADSTITGRPYPLSFILTATLRGVPLQSGGQMVSLPSLPVIFTFVQAASSRWS